jgi:HK97 family phage major capsid protein
MTSTTTQDRLLRHAREQRDALAALAADEMGRPKPDLATIDRYLAESDRHAQRAQQADSRIVVLGEDLTYRHGGEHSYFADCAKASVQGGGSPAAAKRLERHAQEMAVEIPRFEARQSLRSSGPDGTRFEKRVNPNRTPGQGGNSAPPLWLIEDFATAPRPSRILADLAVGYPLPDGVSSVNVPRLVTGVATVVARDGAAAADADIADAATTSPVVPLSGSVDVPLQLLEQSPKNASFDQVVFADGSAAYDAQLEALLMNGSGSNGQFYGLLNVPNINAVTYADASPTGSELWPFLGQAAARIGNNRLLPPEVWLMRTARWAWLGGSEDAQQLPIAPPSEPPEMVQGAGPKSVATILGWPLYCADAIPATLGSTGNQDAILACRPSDVLTWESRPRLSIDYQSLSGTMQVRITVRGSAAAICGRYPQGISAITGTGTVVQSGFNS